MKTCGQSQSPHKMVTWWGFSAGVESIDGSMKTLRSKMCLFRQRCKHIPCCRQCRAYPARSGCCAAIALPIVYRLLCSLFPLVTSDKIFSDRTCIPTSGAAIFSLVRLSVITRQHELYNFFLQARHYYIDLSVLLISLSLLLFLCVYHKACQHPFILVHSAMFCTSLFLLSWVVCTHFTFVVDAVPYTSAVAPRDAM